MTTALSMIERSLRLATVLGKGDILDSDEAADGLEALNAMLDSWQIERLFVYQILKSTHVWPAVTISRTIGTGGDFNVQRPVKIDSAFIIDLNNQTYILDVLRDRAEYDSIVIKTTQSTLPQYVFMDPAYPLGTLFLYPVPSLQLTLHLNTWQTLQEFSGLTTPLNLPPGYKRAIEYNLAREFGAEFDADIPSHTLAIATEAKAAIKTLNQPSMVSQVDFAVASLGKLESGRYNIFSDERTR
jgi:hypothetical protein